MARRLQMLKEVARATAVAVALQTPSGCGLDSQDRAAINEWLECDDCTQAHRRSVWEIPGARAVGKLDQALIGLEDWRLDNLRQQHAAAWRRSGGAAYDDSARYVDRYVGNRQALIRQRAARSLGDIYLTRSGFWGWWARRRAKAEIEAAITRDDSNDISLRAETRQVLDDQLSRIDSGVSQIQIVVVTPETLTTNALSVQLSATVLDELGDVMPNETVSWNVDNPGVTATVDGNGLVTRVDVSVVLVRASAGGVAAVATIDFQ